MRDQMVGDRLTECTSVSNWLNYIMKEYNKPGEDT